jgi:hypothetical protein
MAQQFGLIYMILKVSTGLILVTTLVVQTGCGKRSAEWKKGRKEYVKEQERKDQESYAESELSKTSFEAREFLKDKRSVLDGVEREFADDLVEKFYNNGAKTVHFTSVDEEYVVKKVKGKKRRYVAKRIASILVVEFT